MGSVIKTPSTQPAAIPPVLDNVSELATVLKPRYPRSKLDPMGRKFAKGFRTATMLSGPRPLERRPRRPR